MVANEETWRRGVVLSFASALLQALVAVVVVGIAAALLNATAATMNRAVDRDRDRQLRAHHPDRRAAAVGKGRAFIATLRTLHRPAAVGAAVTPAHRTHVITITAHHDHASRPRS